MWTVFRALSVLCISDIKKTLAHKNQAGSSSTPKHRLYLKSEPRRPHNQPTQHFPLRSGAGAPLCTSGTPPTTSTEPTWTLFLSETGCTCTGRR